MAGWTRFVLRFRWPVLGLWLIVLLAGGYASTRLSPLLENTFTVPGTDSERARHILERHFGDRSDGEFLVIYKIRAASPALRGFGTRMRSWSHEIDCALRKGVNARAE